MYFRFAAHPFSLAMSALLLSATAYATTPIVTVASPANGTTTTSPINYIASASSPGCANGISAVRIYSAPGVSAYTATGGKLNSYINLPKGTYNTVVQAWDYCGGVSKANVTITITGESKPAGFLYTVNSDYFGGGANTTNYVQGFTIVPGNGALALTWQGPVHANIAPFSAASDKGGYRLYVGDYVSGDVYPYFINRSNGYLTPVPGAPFPAGRSVRAVAVHPGGKWIYAALYEQNAGDGVAVFELQNDGSLKPAPGSPYATEFGPQALVVDPSGKYLYAADTPPGQSSSYLDAFQIDAASGVLKKLPGSPFKMRVRSNCVNAGAGPYDLIERAGKTLYTADGSIDSISGFAINGSGALAEMAASPWADNGGCNVDYIYCSSCFWNPTSLALDGAGKFLYAVNTDLADISIYSVGANGGLTYIKDTATGLSPGCFTPIRTDPTGNYLYAGRCGTSLLGFSINHATGDITELPTSPYEFPALSTGTFMESFTVTP